MLTECLLYSRQKAWGFSVLSPVILTAALAEVYTHYYSHFADRETDLREAKVAHPRTRVSCTLNPDSLTPKLPFMAIAIGPQAPLGYQGAVLSASGLLPA